MFENRTYENLLQECLDLAPEGIDIRQGGIYFDALASGCFKLAEFYSDLKFSFDLVFIATAVDEYLDLKGQEFNVFRHPATSAKYLFKWGGPTAPAAGERFFTDRQYFILRDSEDYGLYLEAEIPGAAGNNITVGTAAIPENNIGLGFSMFDELLELGVDQESDERYRFRIQEQIAGPAENGNRQHYKSWAESIPGVGRARIIPLFAGPNTVMGLITDIDGLPAAQPLIDRVQEYIDPRTLGKTVEFEGTIIPVGDGLGDGVANIGAHFAAVAPTPLQINIAFSVELKPGFGVEQVREDVSERITSYLKDLVLTTPDQNIIVVRVSTISSLLYSSEGLLDYQNLTLNGATANVALATREIAILGEVLVDEIV